MRRPRHTHTPKPIAIALGRLFSEMKTTVIGAELGVAHTTIGAYARTDDRASPILVNTLVEILQLAFRDGAPGVRALAKETLDTLCEMVGHRSMALDDDVSTAQSPLGLLGELMSRVGSYTADLVQAQADGRIDGVERRTLLDRVGEMEQLVVEMKAALQGGRT